MFEEPLARPADIVPLAPARGLRSNPIHGITAMRIEHDPARSCQERRQ